MSSCPWNANGNVKNPKLLIYASLYLKNISVKLNSLIRSLETD